MGKSPVLIEFFYDIISPYSFLAFEILHRYKAIWNIDIKLKPSLLAGIMKSSGNKPPLVVPNKAVYMTHDLKRLQKYCQVPLFLPQNLPDLIYKNGTLNAMRFITAVDIVSPNHLEPITRAIWMRLFSEHTDIQESQSLLEAGKSIGMKLELVEQALKTMADQDTKDRLKKYTTEALDYGAFGAPIIVAHVDGKPELFFGSDRFELLSNVIGEKWLGPMPQSSKL